MRREFEISPITINGKKITKLIIDNHINKHVDHINDQLVKKLIATLNNKHVEPESEMENFQYFVSEIKFNMHMYKLVWLLEEKCLYIGVITAFRDRRIK